MQVLADELGLQFAHCASTLQGRQALPVVLLYLAYNMTRASHMHHILRLGRMNFLCG
jgi:hypothetical protein